MTETVVTGSFDDFRSRHVRLLDEASSRGPLHVLLWSDETIRRLGGREPKFPQEERRYFLAAVRHVEQTTLADATSHEALLDYVAAVHPQCWVVDEASVTDSQRSFCESHGIEYCVLGEQTLNTFPPSAPPPPAHDPARKKVIVTGCYDWFHSGHVRFFEECSELGELYVAVGNDENVRLLKGEQHPMFPQEERRYVVQSIRFVAQALMSTGMGWMDAAPEIEKIHPHVYAVNEDGDRPEKREFCEKHGLEYAVLKRLPKGGLPRRESTHLRGF